MQGLGFRNYGPALILGVGLSSIARIDIHVCICESVEFRVDGLGLGV